MAAKCPYKELEQIDITESQDSEDEKSLNEAGLKSILNIIQYRAKTSEEFLENALNEALNLSGSKFGYILFYDEDLRQFTLNTWSHGVVDECRVVDPPVLYDLDRTGIWGEVVRQRKHIILNDYSAEHPFKRGYPEGHVHITKFMSIPIFSDDKIVAIVAVANKKENYNKIDVLQLTLLMGAVWKFVDARRIEDALRESEERFKALHNASFGGITIHDKGVILDCNQGLSEMTGYSTDELVGMNGLLLISENTRDMVIKNIMSGYEKPYEAIGIRKNGEEYPLRLEARKIPYKGKSVRVVEFRDLTELKQADERNIKLQAQLSQANKMESVGRLAGGVAHDFNNMLMVILGYTEMSLDMVEPSDPLYENLTEIRKSAKRSADITRQLLAFARKQTVTPKVLDINETVEGMLKMLNRLIGENIYLHWKPAKDGIWKVKVDPSQIDQILANLCVNARDAIDGVGNVLIETCNLTCDKAYCSAHPYAVPGDYVLLTVSDDGCGMEKEILDNLFEPFFTTKEIGKGTGLGLATIYGIVKQNSGFINVYSEPDKGTAFKIYLPRYMEKISQIHKESQEAPVQHGHETILLVEDDKTILKMGKAMLERLGYRVLTSDTPSKAIDIVQDYGDEIVLLITDVVMPKMSGRDLATAIISQHPQIRSLFMSGYTADMIDHNGVLDEGVHFIQKPFSRNELACKVRDVLNH